MELAQQLEANRTEFENDKRMLEATIADLSMVEDRALSTQASVQEDLRRQAQIAQVSHGPFLLIHCPYCRHQDAHDKYSRELVAHAETVKENTKLKEELLQAQTKTRESENAAEVATAKATNGESNWASQRDALKKELEDVSARCMDLVAQNATLHQHLENVSTQAARIRQAAEAPQTEVSTGDTTAADGEDACAELRGVIASVRREKEIAELQLDLHKQENIRLKAYRDRLNQTLEDTRKLLSEVFDSQFPS
jgi:nucleoprotein TPR